MKLERERNKEAKEGKQGETSLKHTTSPNKPKHKKINASNTPPKHNKGRRNTTMMSTPPNLGF
jgi:hypothetical protein